MKKIEAAIRAEKLDDITEMLEKTGYPGIMVTRIEGHGRQKGITEQFRGRVYKVSFVPKIKIEIVVKDADADKVAQLIASVARTGEVGDGKIFISPVENVIRIRTNEKGENAV